jgi:membrane fusion protein (multidrug efflux system)
MNYNIKKIIRNLSSILLIALVAAACGNGGSQNASAQMRGQQQPQPYPVLKVQQRSITLTTSYPATLKGSQTVEIRPRVEGYIVKMPVDEGSVVQKGEVLFQLQKNQYEQKVRSAKADIQAAKASIQTAKDDVQRLKNLVKQNIVSNYKLKSAEDKLHTQKAKLAQARATLKNAETNLDYTTIKSPVNGSIGTIPYRVGSLVSSSIQQPLTTVSDISTMYAYFTMSEGKLLEMLHQVAETGGRETIQERITKMPKVNLILSDSSTYNHQGNLKLASGHIDTQTGSASLKAIFPNPHGLLRSGSTGEIQIPTSLDSVVVIPKAATYEIQDRRFVYTVTDSNLVISTPIQTRQLSTKKLFVVQSGLSANDVIITAGMGQLRDSAKIIPQPVNADSLYQALGKKDKQLVKQSADESQH